MINFTMLTFYMFTFYLKKLKNEVIILTNFNLELEKDSEFVS